MMSPTRKHAPLGRMVITLVVAMGPIAPSWGGVPARQEESSAQVDAQPPTDHPPMTEPAAKTDPQPASLEPRDSQKGQDALLTSTAAALDPSNHQDKATSNQDNAQPDAQEKDQSEAVSKTPEAFEVPPNLLADLKARSIGPAFMSGRIGDIAIHPDQPSTWYVAASSGGVWKTENRGATWTPIFDSYGSYSIGCLAIDPKDPLVVWVGTGENNSQRSVGYGDGLYKSIDGGKSFRKVGLEMSEHIAKILIDPRNTNVVYVAAQGPLWNSGGERGLYKTTDGGASWNRVLHIDDDTGVTDIAFDPRDPDLIYAATYQRRRHVWTLVNGGPGSGVHKSTDGGQTWRKIDRGLPTVERGRIGLAVSPIRPDVVYAWVEAADDQSGFFRSSDKGESFVKMSSFISTSPQYYQEIVADPHVFDRVYAMDTYLKVTEDGGKTFVNVGEKWKHVDNHALVIDPHDPEHLLVGCDGGLYETFDRGRNYTFFANLPITQFYKIAVDDATPFYNVYGGTQDNATQGGPSRTNNVHGIRNSDWFVTVFGDGFDPAVEPGNPDVVYSQWQYGGLVRHDRKTGETLDIKPREEKEEEPLRWNWDSPLLISPHSPTRIYYAAQKLFRSDDRGMTWRAVSPDLTRQIDRNSLKVMGRIQSVDAVAKNNSTSFYGNITAIAESPKVENLLYVGTDDGLVQISEDGGQTWRKVDGYGFAEAPADGYIADIECSPLSPDIAYVAVQNYKNGDFKPYLLKTTDRGQTWTLISKGLPERGSVYCLAIDHVNENILFVGTEFGLHVTLDGGIHWRPLPAGMPVIAVRDLEIQRREEDLVIGTFGRGIYILDDYSPLRALTPENLARPAMIAPIKPGRLFVPSEPLSASEKGYQGSGFFTAPNPPLGVTFTYYLKDGLKTRKASRQERERLLAKEGKDTPYPSWEDLKAEDREEPPAVMVTIQDAEGRMVRRLKGSTSSGVHRLTWDLRHAGVTRPGDDFGPLALPGTYTVSLETVVDGEPTRLVEPVGFEAQPLGLDPALPAQDRAETLAFQNKLAQLQRVMLGTNAALREAQTQVEAMILAADTAPGVGGELRKEARALKRRLIDLSELLNGDPTRARRSEPVPESLMDRLNTAVSGTWTITTGPTHTHRRQYELAAEGFKPVYEAIRNAIETDLPALGNRLEEAGAPWTPGRSLPRWTP